MCAARAPCPRSRPPRTRALIAEAAGRPGQSAPLHQPGYYIASKQVSGNARQREVISLSCQGPWWEANVTEK